ncbi:hypothetical protein [Aestuariicoccus sp. MJ-SS9]|uniref:hypothetical protein n=1 Tax=Aestuariicoccus sp. MJ-SS9 TaxID=3079855 RepID=UPI00292DD2DC|nr:hypothetical protein [Aestuariicoccus sp. MJ-SS9]
MAAIYARMLTALLPLIPLYLAAIVSQDVAFTHFVNRTGPVWFVMILSFGAFYLLRHDVRLIWTPILWLPIQSAVFFGFGPLVAVFGNDITQQKLANSFLSVSPDELIWASQLSTVGVFCLLFGVFLHLTLSHRSWESAFSEVRVTRSPMSPRQVAIVFVIFGGVLKYWMALPSQWGMTSMIVPGFLTTVVKLLDVGFAIMAFLAARGDSQMRRLLLLLLPIHVILSGLTFSKNQLITALLFPVIGDIMGRRSLRRFTLLVVVIALVYGSSQDFVHYGRGKIMEETGTISQAGYFERFSISASYMLGEQSPVAYSSDEEMSEMQGWWTRLNYAGVQVAARNLHLAGVPNDSLQNVWLYFIPRFVWPEKPIVVPPGWFFYTELTGREGTFLGLSIYGDLFWLGGWAATMVGTFLIGWVLAMMSLRSMRFIRDQNFLMFPLVLLPLSVAMFGPTSFVSNGIISAIPMYLAYTLLMRLVAKLVAGLPRRRSPHISRS